MRYVQTGLLIVFLLAVLIFAAQNTAATPVNFFRWSSRPPLALLVVGVYLLGMVSGWTVLGFVRRSIRGASSRPRDPS
jgi:uncharacterized integral membrane protein